MQVIKTNDNSSTIFSEQFSEHYHSVFGAENESMFIYINTGLAKVDKQHITVFEMGMGTGLNVILAIEFAKINNKIIDYYTVEKFPISNTEVEKLNFNTEGIEYLSLVHSAKWNNCTNITSFFTLHKYNCDISNFTHSQMYDVVFYDAFSYNTQPELWSVDIFKAIYNSMFYGGLFVTYSVKGVIKRNLRECGFKVKKVKGPEGKREILMATKRKDTL